jgi:hypothetical protein
LSCITMIGATPVANRPRWGSDEEGMKYVSYHGLDVIM